MKANTEYYVVLINNQITDFTKLSLVNICQVFFFEVLLCAKHSVSEPAYKTKAVLEELTD